MRSNFIRGLINEVWVMEGIQDLGARRRIYGEDHHCETGCAEYSAGFDRYVKHDEAAGEFGS